MNDPFNLERFLNAQQPVFRAVVAELKVGRKSTHWMWFVFPQMRGLGSSAMAERYGIVSLEEARAFLAHPELGRNIRACTEIVLSLEGRSLDQIFGSPDDAKFFSSMTLFTRAADNAQSAFARALERYCGGSMDARTLELLAARLA